MRITRRDVRLLKKNMFKKPCVTYIPSENRVKPIDGTLSEITYIGKNICSFSFDFIPGFKMMSQIDTIANDHKSFTSGPAIFKIKEEE